MFSKKEVENIAKLARLELTKEETGKFQKELSSILDYIEKLKEVNISGVESASRSVLSENVMRQDKENKKHKENSEKLLALAPETKGGYVKVKSIMSRN